MPTPRVSIRRLMVAVACSGAILAIARRNPVMAIAAPCVAALGGMAWSLSRRRPALATRGFFASVAWLNASLLVSIALDPALRRSALPSLASLAFLGIAPGFGLAWVATRAGRSARLRASLVAAVLVALPASMVATRWPLLLAFFLSSPALNRLADRVESGEAVPFPAWAGIYRVAATIPHLGDTALLVDDDPSDMTGFVRRRRAGAGRWDTLDLRGGRAGRWYYLD